MSENPSFQLMNSIYKCQDFAPNPTGTTTYEARAENIGSVYAMLNK